MNVKRKKEEKKNLQEPDPVFYKTQASESKS